MKRFFRIVWKINAVFILLAGLLLILGLGMVLVSFMLPRTFDGPSISVTKPGETAHEDEKLVVSTVEELAGTAIVRCQVQTSGTGRSEMSSFGSGTSSVIRNYLFYDLATDQQTSLFPTTEAVISDCTDYYFPDQPSDKRTVKWTSFVFADKDTNHDGRISNDDLKSLAVTHADGTDYNVYLSNLDQVLKTDLANENTLIVFYEQNGSTSFARIDLAGHKILLTKKVF